MTHSHDNITVGNITLVYSGKHHGWITPYNEVIKNPFKAQRPASYRRYLPYSIRMLDHFSAD
ncbi:DUF1317 family protein [Yersinia enterocolitica]